jgi:HEAT repeat protein
VVQGKAGRYLSMLTEGDDGDRKKAAKELKDFNMPVVVNALVGALQHDGSSGVRKEAANSLGQLMARKSLPALRDAAREDEDKGVRKAALKSANKIESAYGVEE